MREKSVWYLAAVAGTSIMATLGVFVRQVSAGNEFAIALGRFGIGFLCLAGLGTLKGGDRAGNPVRITWGLAGSGVFLAVFVICYFKAVTSGTLTSAAFLLYLGPSIASALAALWLEEGFDRSSGLLLGVALLGTLFITEFRLPDEPDQLEGLVFGFLSGFFYGLFLLFNNSKMQGTVNRSASAFFQLLVASAALVPAVIVSGVNLSLSDAPWIASIGVFHGFLALTLVIMALGHLKTIEYSTISYGEPVMAALLGVAFYDEKISLLQVVGCFCVLGAGMARVFMQENV